MEASPDSIRPEERKRKMTGKDLRKLFGPCTWIYEAHTNEEAQKLIDEEGEDLAISTCLLWEEVDPDVSEEKLEALRDRINLHVERQERAKKIVDLLDEEEAFFYALDLASSEEEVDSLLDDLFAKLDE